MLTWDKKFLVPIIPSTEFKQIIENSKNNNINKIKEIDKIEQEYYDKIQTINNLDKNKDDLNILLRQNSLKLIKEELSLIKLFSKYSLQQNNYEINFLIKILNLLFNISEELKKRLNQPDIYHKTRRDKQIMRCSYKFCNFKSDCNYHYKHKKCNSDHFVHNMVSADLKNLIDFFNKKTGKEFVSNKEVIKSINTLLYVISHMESELSNSCRYETEDKWANFHI
ncbi:hypothetical protein crov353 [Cafeteria roenbergensis virus]|uniref:Uncharacterized protein n=1 Tax=Cafeteria roenbergensis virus (strain BV-PW1) TaxID=693272 RepID=E3T5C4_CROVB|nr:hypothetical protein crov353 [Cafeteria roenbergensis virus BV-PW1]ADO67387.1 hypothetical protein crov353 [Cafeteria roenbergensis virus BV-PW1]